MQHVCQNGQASWNGKMVPNKFQMVIQVGRIPGKWESCVLTRKQLSNPLFVEQDLMALKCFNLWKRCIRKTVNQRGLIGKM